MYLNFQYCNVPWIVSCYWNEQNNLYLVSYLGGKCKSTALGISVAWEADPRQLSPRKMRATTENWAREGLPLFVINWGLCNDLRAREASRPRATLLGDIDSPIALTATLRPPVDSRQFEVGKTTGWHYLTNGAAPGNFLECLLMFYGRNFFKVVRGLTR